MNLFRRSAAPDQDEEDASLVADGSDGAEYDEVEGEASAGPVTAASRPVSSSSSQPSEKQQKASQRASRMDLVRQARKASSAMQDPEPVRGLMVAAFLVLVGLVSYFSNDVESVSQKVHGKTQVVSEPITHPATAVLLIVVALVCAGTIYWRKRYVTGIAFMISAAIGIGAPLPKSLSDLMWLTFLVPAGYVLWLLMFRMNKEQKAWLAAHGGGSRSSGGTAASTSRQKATAQKGQTAPSTSRSRKKDQAATSATGRPLPQNSGRYTRPKAKPKASAGPK